jgi:hypothetical protein
MDALWAISLGPPDLLNLLAISKHTLLLTFVHLHGPDLPFTSYASSQSMYSAFEFSN